MDRDLSQYSLELADNFCCNYPLHLSTSTYSANGLARPYGLLLSEHLEPETVSFHCHSPQLIVLFAVHSSFTSTDIILIGNAKLSQTRLILLVGAARKK